MADKDPVYTPIIRLKHENDMCPFAIDRIAPKCRSKNFLEMELRQYIDKDRKESEILKKQLQNKKCDSDIEETSSLSYFNYDDNKEAIISLKKTQNHDNINI